MSEPTKAENKAKMAEYMIGQYDARARREAAPAAGSPLTRTVTLTLSEHVLLVRTIRERAYSLRLFARTTSDSGLARNAIEGAERLEARADELANTQRSHPAHNNTHHEALQTKEL